MTYNCLTPKPRRRWLRFSLRTLLVAITVLCVWLGYSLNWIRQRHEFLESMKIHDVYSGKPSVPPSAPFCLGLFGESGIEDMRVTKDEAVTAQDLFPESKLFIGLSPAEEEARRLEVQRRPYRGARPLNLHY